MSTRSENKRELERALNGLEGEYGIETHINRVLLSMEKVIKDITEYNRQNPHTPQEIPELYKEIVGYLLITLETLDVAKQGIQKTLEVL